MSGASASLGPATRVPLAPSLRSLARSRVTSQTGTEHLFPPRAFFEQPTERVARALLGAMLVTVRSDASGPPQLCGGRIVESEAYLGESDPACHASRGLTERTRAFYNPGGTAYVFSAYGVHLCFNVVTLPAGQAGCVLVRALEPLFGLPAMARRRAVNEAQVSRLCSGPGRLSQALGIRKDDTGSSVLQGPVLILTSSVGPPPVTVGPRVGISVAVDWPQRYSVTNSPWIST
jgi:DNA-3-methyladenine glycosylase